MRLPRKVSKGETLSATEWNSMVDFLRSLRPVSTPSVSADWTIDGVKHRTNRPRSGGGSAPCRYQIAVTTGTEMTIHIGPGSRRVIGGAWTDDAARDFEGPILSGTYHVYMQYTYGTGGDFGTWVTGDNGPFFFSDTLPDEGTTSRVIRLGHIIVDSGFGLVADVVQRHFSDVEVHEIQGCDDIPEGD